MDDSDRRGSGSWAFHRGPRKSRAGLCNRGVLWHTELLLASRVCRGTGERRQGAATQERHRQVCRTLSAGHRGTVLVLPDPLAFFSSYHLWALGPGGRDLDRISLSHSRGPARLQPERMMDTHAVTD